MLSRLKQNICQEITTISTKELKSTQYLPYFSRLHSVWGPTFSAFAVELGVLLAFLKAIITTYTFLPSFP
jgi:hypothetical protein